MTLLLWSVSSYFGPVTEQRLRLAKAIAFSYNFSRRDCRVGKVMTALEFYGGTVLLLLLSYVAGTLGAFLYQWRRKKSRHEQWWWRPAKPRVLRAALIIYAITYMELAQRTFRLMACQQVPRTGAQANEWVLRFDQATACWTGAHTAIYVFCLLVIMFYLVLIALLHP